MSNVIVTASSAALVHACGYSFRRDVVCPPQTSKPETERGTAFGLLAEAFVNGGPHKAHEAIAKLDSNELKRCSYMWWNARAWLEANIKPGWVAERAFCYSPAFDEARELPRLEHRDYSDAGTGETVAGPA